MKNSEKILKLEKEVADLRNKLDEKKQINVPWLELGGMLLFLGLVYFNFHFFTDALVILSMKPNEIGLNNLVTAQNLFWFDIYVFGAVISAVAMLNGGYERLKPIDAVGLFGGLFASLIVGLFVSLIAGLIVGLFDGLIVGLFAGLIIVGLFDDFDEERKKGVKIENLVKE